MTPKERSQNVETFRTASARIKKELASAKPPASSSKPATPAKSKSRTGARVLELGGSNVTKGTLKKKPQGKPPATNSNFMSSSSTYTGSNLDKPKPIKAQKGRRYSGGTRSTPTSKATAPNRYQRRRRGM